MEIGCVGVDHQRLEEKREDYFDQHVAGLIHGHRLNFTDDIRITGAYEDLMNLFRQTGGE